MANNSLPRPRQPGGADWSDSDYMAYWRSRSIVTPNGCIEWQGWKMIGRFMYDRNKGYPMAGYRGKPQRITRIVLGWKIGRPLTKDELACHKCDNPPCINPDHLWVGSVSANTQDRLSKGRDHHSSLTHCPRGHSYAEHGVRHGKAQFRHCKICVRAKARIKAGWPEDIAYSTDPLPKGQFLRLGHWERRGGNKPKQSRT
jgi:hypothetical protein